MKKIDDDFEAIEKFADERILQYSNKLKEKLEKLQKDNPKLFNKKLIEKK